MCPVLGAGANENLNKSSNVPLPEHSSELRRRSDLVPILDLWDPSKKKKRAIREATEKQGPAPTDRVLSATLERQDSRGEPCGSSYSAPSSYL